MEVCRCELSLYSVVGSACTKLLALWRILAVGVAALHHEVLDDAMEQRSVVETLFNELQHIVTMFRGVVVEAHDDVALRCLDLYLCHCRNIYVYD